MNEDCDAQGGAADGSATLAHSIAERGLTVFIVAGEHSGDALGADLMAELNARLGDRVRYLGVGGPGMAQQGLISQFPLSDVAVMGPVNILKALPRITRRVYRTVDAVVSAEPDILVIIDSPEFTHPIAKRVRKRRPEIPIVDYVSPSVWAWRPGRAKKMAPYVDHLLALLPFEPEAHRRLGGPACTYVGHPLGEKRAWIEALDPAPLVQELGLDPSKPVLVVLPGSRRSEVERLMAPFGETIGLLRSRGIDAEVIVPAVDHLRSEIEVASASWPVRPHILSGEEAKFRAFRLATAALAASGTVTLELAVSGVPAVVAYKVDAIAARLRFLVNVPSVVLANLVLEENAYPEFIQEACTPERLAGALFPLMGDTAERRMQLEALASVPGKLQRSDGRHPSQIAADVVLREVLAGERA